MSGPRYSGWTPIVVVGDREVAAQHVPEARKLLGFVLEEAKRNGLGIANLRRELQDGTVLLAEKIGELPRVTIIAPGPPPVEEPPEHRGGFIVWPRWDVPTGDPAQRGSQVDPTGNDPTGWLEFAGSRVVTRYWRRWDVVDQIQGARYESYNRPDLYPEGLYFFGNIDWKDGEDLALSFYGFCSRYVHDVALLDIGARWVLQQGQALFDRISYRDELQQDPRNTCRGGSAPPACARRRPEPRSWWWRSPTTPKASPPPRSRPLWPSGCIGTRGRRRRVTGSSSPAAIDCWE